MNKSLWNIFFLFIKIGALLIGGGYVILPLLRCEMIEKRNWITSEELCDFYALSQSIPGLIAANISIFVGYKLRGKFGALAAVVGMTVAPFFSIVVLASVLHKIIHFSAVQSLLWGVGIGVVILLYLAVKEMWVNSVTDRFSLLLFLTVLAVFLVFDFSPAITIIAAAILGIIHKKIERTKYD